MEKKGNKKKKVVKKDTKKQVSKKKNSENKVLNDKNKMIDKKYILVVICLAIVTFGASFLTSFFINKKDDNATLKTLVIKDNISYEIGNNLPNNKDYFENYDDEIIEKMTFYKDGELVDELTVGSYEVEITINDKVYKTQINVVDTTKPVLKLKEVTINEDESYTIDSFIDKCSDNSNKECHIEFGNEEMASYSKEGTYIIEIIAKDDFDNVANVETKLIINKIEVDNNEVVTNNKKNNTSADNKGTSTTSSSTNNSSTNKSTNSNTSSKQNSSTNTGKNDNTSTTKQNENTSTNTGSTSNQNSSTNSGTLQTFQVTLIMDDGHNMSILGVREGSTIPKNVETTREGRTFKEWQLDGKTFDINTKITSDITLKAVYADKPVITYKYGVKISTINGYSTYDFSTFNGTTNDIKPEAISVATSNSAIYNELLGYVNGLRSSEGKSALTLDTTLSQAATLRAIEMAWASKFSHTRPNGTSCFTVLNEFGVVASYYGENVAMGQTSAKQAYNDWNNSPGHHANMVGEFNKIGIGKYTLNGMTYWVQLFTMQ